MYRGHLDGHTEQAAVTTDVDVKWINHASERIRYISELMSKVNTGQSDIIPQGFHLKKSVVLKQPCKTDCDTEQMIQQLLQ